MSRFESLDVRRLFSQFGLDPTFGTNGTGSDISDHSISTTIDTGAAIYVAFNDLGAERFDTYEPPYIARLTETGEIDTTWGQNGVAELSFRPEKLAYDRRTGKLYAAGKVVAGAVDPEDPDYPRPCALAVARLTADGVLDSAYGTGGVATYLPPTPASADFVTASPKHLLVRPHGGLDVGLDVQKATTVPDEYGYDFSHAMTVVRLKNNGQRDVAFGRRGVASVTEGFDYTSFAVLRYDVSGSLDAMTSTTSDPGVFVRRQTFTDDGFVSGRSAWQVPADDADAATAASFQGGPASIVADNATVYVTDNAGSTLYELVPGSAPEARPLAGGLAGVLENVELLPAPRGGYFAAGTFGPDSPYTGAGVARLRPDFSIDRRWGDRGVIALGTNGNTLVPDANGRLLDLGNPFPIRYDGYRGTKPVTGVRAGQARLTDDLLRVQGTSGPDAIAVRQIVDSPYLVVTINGVEAKRITYSQANCVVIDAGAGDDSIAIEQTSMKKIVLAGRGNDTVVATNASSYAGSGFTIRGGPGQDTIRLTSSAATRLDGGAGDDSLELDDESDGLNEQTVIDGIETRKSV